MVDLDSNPTKLIEIVEIGKQMLMTRGSLTTFSIANDVAKYFAIMPAAFAATYPELGALNVMRLATPASADPLGRDLQRADHRRADPARAARRALPAARRRGAPAPQPVVYGLGGLDRARSSASRSSTSCSSACSGSLRSCHATCCENSRPALLALLGAHRC